MSVQLAAAAAIRWVGLLGLATLVGSLVVQALLPSRDAPLAAGAARRLRRLGAASLAVLAVTTVGELLTRAQTMAGEGLAAAVGAVPMVLTRTHFGAVWIGRFVLLAVICLLIGAAARPARLIAIGLALALGLTTSLTGHGADWGDLTWTTAADWVHVAAVSTWGGGLLALALVVLGDAQRWPPALLGILVRRFSRLAGFCLVPVLVSGGGNAWAQLPSVSALWTMPYGRILGAKLLLVLGVIGLGAVNHYAILPRLGGRRASGIGERLFRVARLVARGSRRAARPAPARLRAGVRGEAALIVLVLAVTAVLVESTPARHAEHAGHGNGEPRGPFRITMEELHQSGGVPRGWTFTPPAGDVERGRVVFIRLGCLACHEIGGDRIAAAPARGPDLRGVGDHHPAGYILESILNPSAVIVQAPGYSTPDGRSIMPDYRGQLTVSELIDLVAYVRSL